MRNCTSHSSEQCSRSRSDSRIDDALVQINERETVEIHHQGEH